MSLYKIGTQLKIIKTASAVEDLVIDRPLTERSPSTKILEPKDSDFVYIRARAISAMETNGPNGNFDAFPWKELQASYETFIGRNLFLNHESDSPIKSVGKIIDSSLIEDPETNEKYVECIAKIDQRLHPEIARMVSTGVLNTVSMGCSCDESTCSVCGTKLHSDADEKCEHLSALGLGKQYTAEVNFPEFNIKLGDRIKAYAINSGINFNELSIVNVPADSKAIIKTVISNIRQRLTKKASLSKEEQLDLVAQMDNLFSKLDTDTAKELKAEFCGCPTVKEAKQETICDTCAVPLESEKSIQEHKDKKHKVIEEYSKESSMSDKNIVSEDQKKILSKISALEMEQLESYIQHKTKKANEVVNKEVVADAAKKEESFLSKIVAKVKDSFAAQLLEKKVEAVAKEELGKTHCEECGCPTENGVHKAPHANCTHQNEVRREISAKFNEDKKNILASTWSISHNGNLLIEASLKDIWGSTFETLSFEDQKYATSAEYAKDAVSRLLTDGLPKLAYYWDVPTKIEKTAANGEFFKASNFFVVGSDSANNWKPEDIKKYDEKDGHVVTEYTFKFPGQEEGQKGPASTGIPQVKTEYPFKRPEGSDFKGGSDSSNKYTPEKVKSADEGKGPGYGHVETKYDFKRQEGKDFVGGSDSSNKVTPEEIKKASLKTASEPKLGPDGTRAKPTTGTDNKKHDVKNSPIGKPGQESEQKGPAAPAGKDVKIDYTIKGPGQEVSQKGPAAPTHEDLKTEYKVSKPEGKKFDPKNPAEEKDLKKSEKEMKTDYTPEYKEHQKEEEKGSKKEADQKPLKKAPFKVINTAEEAREYAVGWQHWMSQQNLSYGEIADWQAYFEQLSDRFPELKDEFVENGIIGKKASVNYKEANAQIKWSAMSPEAQDFIKKHVEKHIKEDGMERAQAVAAAYSEAREKGMDVPKASSQEIIMEKKADGSTIPDGTKTVGDAPIESSKESTLPTSNIITEEKPEEAVGGEDTVSALPENTVVKSAAEKPSEAVDGSTLPKSKKPFTSKPEEASKESTEPKSSATSGSKPEESSKSTLPEGKKTYTGKPDEASKDSTQPKEKGTAGQTPEEASKESTQPKSKETFGDTPDEAVKGSTQSKAALETKADNKDLTAPPVTDKVMSDKPDVAVSKEESVGAYGSALDKAEKLDIGEGYSAAKDKETKEIIISKDGKEVKRLPDGFANEVPEVLKLLRAVLGLPPVEEKKPEMAPVTPEAPKMEETPKPEEHPALEEAHEDEMGMKESALKVREEAISKKEAELKAIEVKAQEEEKAKKFAALLSARSERCQKIVANMVDKEAIKQDEVVLQTELKNGTYLLDAQHKAFQASIKAKHKELLAMDDMSLKAFEKAVEELPVPSHVSNSKKATRVPYLTYDPSETDEVGNIFRQMGTLKGKTINDVPKK